MASILNGKNVMLIGLRGEQGPQGVPGVGVPVVQEKGTSTDSVMSQAAVTQALDETVEGIESNPECFKNFIDYVFEPVNLTPNVGEGTIWGDFGRQYSDWGYIWNDTGAPAIVSFSQNTYRAYPEVIEAVAGCRYRFTEFFGVVCFIGVGENGDTCHLEKFDCVSNTTDFTYEFTAPEGTTGILLSCGTYETRVVGTFGDVYRLTPTDEEKTELDITIPRMILTAEQAAGLPELPDTRKLAGKTIVNLGDSIFGNETADESISKKLADLTGATVHNCAFGGTRMSKHHYDQYTAFSAYKLAQAVVSGDFTEQEAALEGTEVTLPTDYAGHLETLKNLDFSEVDIVTISFGTNDWTGRVPVTNTNKTSNQIFDNAMQYVITTLLGAYPHLNIVFCTPTFRVSLDESNEYSTDSDAQTITDSWSDNPQTLVDFANKIKEVCKNNHLSVIDNYDVGINKYNYAYYLRTGDGVHHNDIGRQRLAEHIANELY